MGPLTVDQCRLCIEVLLSVRDGAERSFGSDPSEENWQMLVDIDSVLSALSLDLDERVRHSLLW